MSERAELRARSLQRAQALADELVASTQGASRVAAVKLRAELAGASSTVAELRALALLRARSQVFVLERGTPAKGATRVSVTALRAELEYFGQSLEREAGAPMQDGGAS